MPNTRNNSTASAVSASSDPDVFHSSPRSVAVQTRSVAFGSAVAVISRDTTPPSDDDIMFITVRLSNPFRRGSTHGAEDLPSRPPGRSFFRRLSTRLNLDRAAEREERYKGIKVPRRDYKKYFRHDVDGNYAGTEPEREWEEAELMERFGEYQNIPLARNFG